MRWKIPSKGRTATGNAPLSGTPRRRRPSVEPRWLERRLRESARRRRDRTSVRLRGVLPHRHRALYDAGNRSWRLPANEETYSDSFWEEPQEYFDGQSYELILEVAEEVPELRYHEEHAEVLDEMETQLEEVLQGNVAPNEIGAQAQEAVADRTGLDTA
ncbi:hypothetical protein D8S78_07980 [Natrialba swarupiae]|nr:hypothetical protein [Natrialba swarupiae]